MIGERVVMVSNLHPETFKKCCVTLNTDLFYNQQMLHMEEQMHHGKKETSRIEAFSDGVFSIAITLLVLDIHVPNFEGDQSLIQLLMEDWTTYLAFLVGFFTLLVCWINHHFMFEYIRRNSGMLQLLNGFKLLVVSFTPFATALISKSLGTPQQATAVSIYTGNFFLMGLSMTSMWVYSCRKDLVVIDSQIRFKACVQLYVFASILSGLIFIISFMNVWLSAAFFILMFIVFVFPKNMVDMIEKRSMVADVGT